MQPVQYTLFKKEEGDLRFLELKKHSALAQMNNDMSLQQRKSMNVFLLIAKDILKRQPWANVFQVELWVLKWLAWINNNDNTKLKKDLYQLVNLVFEYNILNKDKNSRGAFSFLSHIDISSKKWQTAIVTFSLPPPILAAIPEPEMWVRLRFYIQRNLTSKYSLSMRENMSDYKWIHKIKINMERFRRLMGITPEKYSTVSMLRKKVIDVAVSEVNEKTELQIKYELIKTWRKVTDIQFYIKSKREESTFEKSSQQIVEKLRYYWYKDKQIKKLLDAHDGDYLMANIAVIEEYLEGGKKIDNVKKYLSKAFIEDFTSEESEYEKENKLKDKWKMLALEQVNEQRAEEYEIEDQFKQYKRELVKSKLSDLNKEGMKELEENFLDSIKHVPAMVKAYKEWGLDNSFIEVSRYRFLASQLLSESDQDFEEFKRKILKK